MRHAARCSVDGSLHPGGPYAAEGTLFNDRVNQVDVNFSRSFRVNGNVDVRPEVSIFNLLNANPVTSVTNTWGPALDRVNAILEPRLVRLGLTIRF